MTSAMIDSDDDDGSVPGLLTAVRLGTGDGAVFRVGREGILVFMGTGSRDDCSLGSHNHVPSTQSRVSACHQVWGAPPTTIPSTNKHDMNTQTQVLIVKREQEKNKSHCLETCLQTRILRETLNLAVDHVCPIV